MLGDLCDNCPVNYTPAQTDTDGNLQWIRQEGTADGEAGYAVAADSAGNIYVTGIAFDSDFFRPRFGGNDYFIIKYGTDGSMTRSNQFGDYNHDQGSTILLDQSGNAYIGGSTRSALGSQNVGGLDFFIMKTGECPD